MLTRISTYVLSSLVVCARHHPLTCCASALFSQAKGRFLEQSESGKWQAPQSLNTRLDRAQCPCLRSQTTYQHTCHSLAPRFHRPPPADNALLLVEKFLRQRDAAFLSKENQVRDITGAAEPQRMAQSDSVPMPVAADYMPTHLQRFCSQVRPCPFTFEHR